MVARRQMRETNRQRDKEKRPADHDASALTCVTLASFLRMGLQVIVDGSIDRWEKTFLAKLR
jgi:hypothetical protein